MTRVAYVYPNSRREMIARWATKFAEIAEAEVIAEEGDSVDFNVIDEIGSIDANFAGHSQCTCAVYRRHAKNIPGGHGSICFAKGLHFAK